MTTALHTTTAPQVPQGEPQTVDSAADSVGRSIEQIGESVSETGQMILEGEWSAVAARLVDGATETIGSLFPNVISGLFVGVVFYALFLVAFRLTRRLLRRSPQVSSGLETLLLRTLHVLGLGFILVVVLSQFGVNVAALIAGLGIAGIALGFAAKDTLENFIAGVTILLDRPFSIGDFVEVEGTYGEVVESTLRSTRLRTLGNRTLVMPNVLMINQSVKNFSVPGQKEGLRVDIPFGIAYKERPARAREVALSLVEGDDRLRDDRPADVVVREMADSSVNMALRVFVKDPGDEYPIRFEYTERLREALRDADIEIPFPHLQLHIDEAKAFADGSVVVPGAGEATDGER